MVFEASLATTTTNGDDKDTDTDTDNPSPGCPCPERECGSRIVSGIPTGWSTSMWQMDPKDQKTHKVQGTACE